MTKFKLDFEGGFDLLITFDTTGSMYPVFHQVLTNVEGLCTRLFDTVPGLRVGIIAHGDYCDGPRVISFLDLTNDRRKVIDFVRSVQPTGGGDAPECYEFVLNQARSAKWQATRERVMVMIGDEVPHSATEMQNKRKLDWKNEARMLKESRVTVIPVQARGLREANWFYDGLGEIFGTPKVPLASFRDVEPIIIATTLKFVSADLFKSFEEELRSANQMPFTLEDAFDALSSRTRKTRTKRKDNLIPEDPNRFQILRVVTSPDPKKQPQLNDFINGLGLKFTTGKAFYPHVTRTEKISWHKEVILEDLSTGQIFTGKGARARLGLPTNGLSTDPEVALRPNPLPGFKVWIQSTSSNRKLRETELMWDVTTDKAVRGSVHSRAS